MSNVIQVNDYFVQILADSKDAGFLRLVSTIPDIFAMRKRNTYRCSLHKLPEILQILRGISTPEQISDPIIRSYLQEELVRRERTALLKQYGPDYTSDWLWEHQSLGIELAQVNRRYNFFYDTRTGKTLMSLKIMYDRLLSRQAKRCLVICPSAIVQAWISDAQHPKLRGPKMVAYYSDADNKFNALNTPAHIVVWATNLVAPNIDLLKQINFDLCFFDESSKAKDYKSQTSEAIFDLSMTIPSWYNLSATPAPNGEDEYYTQMRCVDPYVFSPAVTHFQEKYFQNKSREPRKYSKLVIWPHMKDEFMAKVEEHSIYVDQDVMPTAGKEWIPICYEMSDEEKEVYDIFRSEAAVEVDGKTITADFAAAVRSKLNQITGGFILDTEARKFNAIQRKLHYTEFDKEVYRIPGRSRLTALQYLIDDLPGEKLIIWANYEEEFRMLSEFFGDSAMVIRGGSTVSYKEAAVTAFKTGKVRHLICHPLSIGMGVNLTESHIAIYFGLNDSWEALKQSSERICGHITVQPKKAEFYMLQARGTVNEIIYSNLKNKREDSYGMLEHLQARFLIDE